MSTARLLLRPFDPEIPGDADALSALAGPASGASSVFYPLPLFTREEAVTLIERERKRFADHQGATFAVETQGQLCGMVGLRCEFTHRRAELGFWIQADELSLITEAVRCLIGYGFGHFRFNRVYAAPPASDIVMQEALDRIGFIREGCRREHVFTPARGPEDVMDYGLLLHEWAEVAHREA